MTVCIPAMTKDPVQLDRLNETDHATEDYFNALSRSNSCFFCILYVIVESNHLFTGSFQRFT